VEPEDLIRYGLIPEFVGRLPVVGVLEELGRGCARTDPLRKPKNALIKQYQGCSRWRRGSSRSVRERPARGGRKAMGAQDGRALPAHHA